MNRETKALFVDEIRNNFANAPFVVLTDFKGSTVAQMDKLRRACEASGAQFRVVKNTLSRRAVDGTEAEILTSHFSGNVGLLFSGEDAIAAAKMFKAAVKENDKLLIKAGFFEGVVLDAKSTIAVAELPSREDLLVGLLRTIQEGPRQVLGVVRAPARDLLYLLSNYANKLEEQG